MAATVLPAPFTAYAGDPESYKRSLQHPMRVARSLQARTSPEHSHRSHVQASTNDSSDDEDLAPIKLSAEAQAILGEDNSHIGSDKDNAIPHPDGGHDSEEPYRNNLDCVESGVRRSPNGEHGSPAPRIVRVNATRPSPRTTFARDGSFMYKIHEKNGATMDPRESKTPAPQVRRIRISGLRSQTKSPPSSRIASRDPSSNGTSTRARSSPDEGEQEDAQEDEHNPAGLSTVTRPVRGEENGIHSTMRVRRIGTGTLLNRPVRRGMIRRQSDEDDNHMGHKLDEQATPEMEQGRRAQEPDLEDIPDEAPISYGSPKHPSKQEYQPRHVLQEKNPSPSHSSITERSPIRRHVLSTSVGHSRPTPQSDGPHQSSKASGSNRKPIFKIPLLPPLESAHDQENEPPPTFKRSKPSAPILEIHEQRQDLEASQKPELPQQQSNMSPSRPPLVPRSNNTPHRPAPAPPPKMSLIEAATSNAGNSRSKKSVHYLLNGRTYRRLDCIGRGGSSRVFRIMAENYKIFALKRVNLEEADTAAIAGYKGEIDLLQQLSNVDRVIRLFDYEINEEKGVLNVMMELGESDFNKMLNEQLKGDNAKLDVTFTRHYWKEMLECVKAVHEHDVVHSDLKPANFLLVKGQLKLIDFGIANAIQDNTVNVHRENQIGTPNYMSPESLVCHTPAAGAKSGPKILKLGKPSDVWSLGCILYQMTYGQPPFAHITKQFERIMSIPNPKVEIKFPTTGIGGKVVPFGLIKTLRRCLQRDQTLRPTISDLLSDSDPFLNPVAISPEMLGRVIGNVVGYCRKREEAMRTDGSLAVEGMSCLPKDEEMRGWPGAFYEKLRQAMEEGTAW